MRTIVNYTKEQKRSLYRHLKPKAKLAGISASQLYQRLSRGVIKEQLLQPTPSAEARARQQINLVREGVNRCNDPEGVSAIISQAWKPRY